ncbi:MAG: hypothetical protein NPMRD1_250005 [Nitrosopumilales archaeon]|nr:MAG: hypothetical protein NPMRD1_250005 [Nitrosopumilales archaeon]
MKINTIFATFTIIVLLNGFLSIYGATIFVEDHSIDYEIDGGSVIFIDLDSDFIELIVYIDATEDGILQISIPRALLDAKFDELDDIFFVIVGGFDTEYVEITNGEDTRTLLIPFFVGDTEIEIIGTETLDEILEEIIIEPEVVIPSWIKSNAGWWAEDKIEDLDFVLGIQFLIIEGIVSIPPTEPSNSNSQEIPEWIKNNAGWWSEDLISDSDFVLGIQYLISNGIMVI